LPCQLALQHETFKIEIQFRLCPGDKKNWGFISGFKSGVTSQTVHTINQDTPQKFQILLITVIHVLCYVLESPERMLAFDQVYVDSSESAKSHYDFVVTEKAKV